MNQDLDTLWNFEDPAAAEITLRGLLTVHETTNDATGAPTGGATDDAQQEIEIIENRWIELKTLLARSLSLQGKLSEARASLDGAKNRLPPGDDHALDVAPVWILWLIEKGRLCVLEKTPSQAPRFLQDAWKRAVDSGHDYFVTDIALLMASIEEPKGRQAWIVRAIEVAEKSTQEKTKARLGELYSSLGWMQAELRQFENALRSFGRARTIFEGLGISDEVFFARWSTGKILRKMNRTEEALEVQNELLSEVASKSVLKGRLYEELAECLQSLKRPEEARPYFELAHQELSDNEWITDNQPLKLKRMKELGKGKMPPKF